ncbi:MAG: M56 family metallopeptidase [Fimbriimonadaceae bacterium]|nr:M56 family metallopeptidase [Fimbriimonadaceae bacterium]
MIAWADGLIRNSVQGGLAILAVLLLTRAFPRIPASAKVWLWRAIALKFLFGTVLPVTLFTQTWRASGYLADDPLPSIILACSLVGLGLAAVTVLRDWVAVRQLTRGGIPTEMAKVEAICQRLRVAQPPTILLRTDLPRPMLSGIWKPTIHLPADLDTEAREMVLAHELAHVKRRDLTWEWLFVILDALYFFHPLVWLMRREHRMAQESACDAIAIQVTKTSLAAYGRMLLQMTISSKTRELALTANMAETYAALHARILRLQHGEKRIGTVPGLLFACLAVLLLPTWRSEFRVAPPRDPFGSSPAASILGNHQRFGAVSAVERSRTPKEGRP